MREAKITINGRELSEPQSRTVRLAILAFLGEMSDHRVAEALGNMALEYHLRLTEVMGIVDETPVEPGPTAGTDEQLLARTLEFIAELAKKEK
jgi:hypothetical protein